MKTTEYFDYVRKRPDRARIKDEWIEFVIENPIRTDSQLDGRIRKWARIETLDKYLRVILLEDGETSTTPSLIGLSRRIKLCE
jgi:hypothetical protein